MHISPKLTQLITGITDREPAGDRRRLQASHPRFQSRKSLSIFTRARELIDESLFRNSAFLWINLIISAVIGIGTITLITRLYPVRAVGLSAAALSATAL